MCGSKGGICIIDGGGAEVVDKVASGRVVNGEGRGGLVGLVVDEEMDCGGGGKVFFKTHGRGRRRHDDEGEAVALVCACAGP